MTNKAHYISYNLKLKQNSRLLRNNMTGAEKKLWYRYLRNFPYRFSRQKPIDKYIADFYCSKLKLVIEVDGWTHSTDEEIERDKKKEEAFKKLGLKILRFNNSDIYKNFNAVCERISDEVETHPNAPTPLYQGGETNPLGKGLS